MTTRLNPITTPRFEARAEKARRNKEAALNAFIGKKAEIDEMLARLQALIDPFEGAVADEGGFLHRLAAGREPGLDLETVAFIAP